ncbi:MAG: putative glycoside hydrolase [Patescibacteria group bacterium]
MNHELKRTVVVSGGIILLFVFIVNVLIPHFLKTSYSAEVFERVETPTKPIVAHLPTPTPLKALYMTACVASTPSWRTSLRKMIEATELNAVVIDIKDSTGTVSFESGVPDSQGGSGCVVPDFKEFIAELHASGIYVIGRISVFQDPSYTSLHPELAVKSKSSGGVWRDRKGLSFVDVGAKPYWDYIVEISKASYALGFDELNYDYVRYPTDGDMDDTDFTWSYASSTRPEMLESFFTFLKTKTDEIGAVTSADLFGMTTTVTSDMGIGQVLERALPHFDYIAPMVYPSHYPSGWNGFANPSEHPYEVIHIAMSEAQRREEIQRISLGLATTTPSKLRPWLQDFNLGTTYGADKIRAQIQATYDSGLDSWMVWSAANKYTEAALLPE